MLKRIGLSVLLVLSLTPPAFGGPKVEPMQNMRSNSGNGEILVCAFENHELKVSAGNCITPVGLGRDVALHFGYALGTDKLTGNMFCISNASYLSHGHHLRLVTDVLDALVIISGCQRMSGQTYPLPSEAFQMTD
jgi:hypothetical protein